MEKIIYQRFTKQISFQRTKFGAQITISPADNLKEFKEVFIDLEENDIKKLAKHLLNLIKTPH